MNVSYRIKENHDEEAKSESTDINGIILSQITPLI